MCETCVASAPHMDTRNWNLCTLICHRKKKKKMQFFPFPKSSTWSCLMYLMTYMYTTWAISTFGCTYCKLFYNYASVYCMWCRAIQTQTWDMFSSSWYFWYSTDMLNVISYLSWLCFGYSWVWFCLHSQYEHFATVEHLPWILSQKLKWWCNINNIQTARFYCWAH